MSDLERAAELLSAGGCVVLTGAGISVASGIPDFRSDVGLWTRFDPSDATIGAFRRHPEGSWALFRAIRETMEGALPNAAHVALADLEALGLIDGIVTQNIDGLHQRAGSRRVVEYHGTIGHLHCVWCGAEYALSSREADPDGVMWCECGRALKPAVVLFGEELPVDAVAQGSQWLASARSVLVVGTSGEVEPAASLPAIASSRAVPVIEVNIARTAITRRCATLHLEGRATQVLPRLASEVMLRVGLTRGTTRVT